MSHRRCRDLPGPFLGRPAVRHGPGRAERRVRRTVPLHGLRDPRPLPPPPDREKPQTRASRPHPPHSLKPGQRVTAGTPLQRTRPLPARQTCPVPEGIQEQVPEVRPMTRYSVDLDQRELIALWGTGEGDLSTRIAALPSDAGTSDLLALVRALTQLPRRLAHLHPPGQRRRLAGARQRGLAPKEGTRGLRRGPRRDRRTAPAARRHDDGLLQRAGRIRPPRRTRPARPRRRDLDEGGPGQGRLGARRGGERRARRPHRPRPAGRAPQPRGRLPRPGRRRRPAPGAGPLRPARAVLRRRPHRGRRRGGALARRRGRGRCPILR